jgi:hypothetical protein
MKRTGFARKVYTPPPRAPLPALTRPVVYIETQRLPVVVPKEAVVRSEEYRRLVAAMPCIVCGVEGSSQAAHADMGKGKGIKTDDRTCYPACSTRPGRAGCHDMMGASGTLTKEERRASERLYGRLTRARILADGMWPTSVPLWDDAKA